MVPASSTRERLTNVQHSGLTEALLPACQQSIAIVQNFSTLMQLWLCTFMDVCVYVACISWILTTYVCRIFSFHVSYMLQYCQILLVYGRLFPLQRKTVSVKNRYQQMNSAAAVDPGARCSKIILLVRWSVIMLPKTLADPLYVSFVIHCIPSYLHGTRGRMHDTVVSTSPRLCKIDLRLTSH